MCRSAWKDIKPFLMNPPPSFGLLPLVRARAAARRLWRGNPAAAFSNARCCNHTATRRRVGGRGRGVDGETPHVICFRTRKHFSDLHMDGGWMQLFTVSVVIIGFVEPLKFLSRTKWRKTCLINSSMEDSDLYTLKCWDPKSCLIIYWVTLVFCRYWSSVIKGWRGGWRKTVDCSQTSTLCWY